MAVVAEATGYYLYDTFEAADAEIKRLEGGLAEIESPRKEVGRNEKSDGSNRRLECEQCCLAGRAARLAAKLPPGRDIVIQRLAMSPARGGRASISFQGSAHEIESRPANGDNVRDARHEIQTPRVEERVQDKSYSWSFDTTISLSTEKLEFDDPDDQDPVKIADDGDESKKLKTSKSRKSKTKSKSQSELKKSPPVEDSKTKVPQVPESKEQEGNQQDEKKPETSEAQS